MFQSAGDPNWQAENPRSGLIVETTTGKRLAYLPAVPQITDSLLSEIESSDVLLFDGTFWDDDELIRVQASGRTAREMGHVPVSESLRSVGTSQTAS